MKILLGIFGPILVVIYPKFHLQFFYFLLF